MPIEYKKICAICGPGSWPFGKASGDRCARRGLNDVMNWYCAWFDPGGNHVVQRGLPTEVPTGMQSYPLVRRNEVALNTIGFISQDSFEPSFLCDMGDKENIHLPLFTPDYEQIKAIDAAAN